MIELNVTALAPCFSLAEKAAVKEVKKSVSMQGFRKGKVPENILQERFSKEIEAEKKHTLANIAFQEAEKLVKILPLNRSSKISYELKSQKEDEAVLSFSFETKPEVPSVDAKSFHLQEISKEVIEEKHINEMLRQSQFFFAQWKEVSDRPVQEGDYILADIETDEEKPQKVFSNTRFEVSDKGMAQWMKKLIIGKNINEILHGVSEPDADVSDEEKNAFEPKKVRVTVTKIEEAELPPIDDAFAERLGTKNVEELKASIKKMLENREEEKVHRQKIEQVEKFLIDNFSFDLPASIVNSEKNFRLERLKKDPQFNARFAKMNAEEKKNAEEEIQTMAKNSIMLYFLCEKIIADAKIKITDEEIKARAIQSGRISDPKKISNDDYALALSQLMLQKAQDYIIKQGS